MTPEPDEELEFTNQALNAALRAMLEVETRESRRAFREALLSSHLILPAAESRPPGDAETEELGENDEIPLLTFANDAGQSILVAFTDEDAALAWEAEAQKTFIGLRGLDLVLIAIQNDIDALALNPGTPSSRRILRDELEKIALGDPGEPPGDASGTTTRTPAGTTVLIAPPEGKPPTSWQESLVGVLEHYPSIESAYFFLLHMAPEGARHVVGLVLYEGMSSNAQDTLMDAVLAEFEELLPDGWTLDFVVLDDRDFLQTVQDTVPPVYERA